MPDDLNNELLMQLVADSGPIPAECRTEVNTDADDLLLDFFNGTFFQVDDFTFGMSLDDQDAFSDAANASGGRGVGAAGQNKSPGPWIPFGKWKNGTVADNTAASFPLNIDEFSFTRRYDCASPVLFDKCGKSESLASAVLVKRKVVGGNMLQAYLRFDFKDVLLTHISWQDADVIKENVKFVFKEMKVQYKVQSSSGKLGAAGSANLTQPMATKGT
jgi:type VI protein secretion system component Hcp